VHGKEDRERPQPGRAEHRLAVDDARRQGGRGQARLRRTHLPRAALLSHGLSQEPGGLRIPGGVGEKMRLHPRATKVPAATAFPDTFFVDSFRPTQTHPALRATFPEPTRVLGPTLAAQMSPSKPRKFRLRAPLLFRIAARALSFPSRDPL